MDARDLALLVIAAYVAVMALVRLMTARHRALSTELRRHMAAQRRREAPADRVSHPA